MRRRARAAPRDGRDRLPPLRPPRARCPTTLHRVRLGVGRAPRRRHRADRDGAAEALGDPEFPILRLDADAARGGKGAVARTLERFEAAPRGRARRHADGRQGPRLPRRDARRRARRRPDAALPRLPRRGAHVRARRAARGPRRARRGGRPRARADARRPTRPRSSPPRATTPTASSPASCERREALRYPPFASLIRVVCSAERARPTRAPRRARCASASRRGPDRQRARAGAAVPAARPRAQPAGRQGDASGARAVAAGRGRRRRGRRERRRGRGAAQRRRRSAVAPHYELSTPMADEQTVSRRAADEEQEQPPRPRGRRAPRGGAELRAQVRRSGAARAARAPVDRFDDDLRTQVEPDGRSSCTTRSASASPRRRSASRTACSSTASSPTPRRRARQPRDRVVRRRGRPLEEGCLSPAGRPRRRRAPDPRARPAQDEHGEPIRSRRPASRRASSSTRSTTSTAC